MSELPKGWELHKLSDVAEIIQGQSPPSSTYNDDGFGMPFFQGKTEFGDLYPTARKYCSEPNKIAEPDDVLISVRAPVGPTNLAHEKSCIGRGLAAIRPLGDSPTRYFLYYLRSIEQELASKGTGTTFQAISGKILKDTKIPIAPLLEQRRIVARIEELFSRLDAGVAALRHAKAQLQRYRQSVLAAAVTGQLTQAWREKHHKGAAEWSHTTLGEIAQIIDPNPSHRYPSYDGGTIPLLATKQMDGVDGWDASSAKLTTADFHHEREVAHGFEKTDVIFARKGRLGLARRPPDLPAFTFSHTVFIIRGDKRVTPNFLLWALRPEGVVTWLIRELNTGAGVPTLGKAILAKLPLRLPTLAEQHKIVAEVEARTTAIDHLEAELDRQITRSNRLRQSTLQSAFSGKI